MHLAVTTASLPQGAEVTEDQESSDRWTVEVDQWRSFGSEAGEGDRFVALAVRVTN